MPSTSLLVFQKAATDVPLLKWLDELEETEPKAYATCLARILLLEKSGHQLRRPTADYLRDGIYELRAKRGRVHYRILYFFCGKDIACLSHAFTKKGAVPASEIEHAIRAKELVENDVDRYTVKWEL